MIKWTVAIGEKLYWSSEISDMLALMLLWPSEERLRHITEMATRIMSCSRCCIILRKDGKDRKEKKLVLVTGYPEKEHGVGCEIKPEYGRDFLEGIISDGNIVLISDPLKDKRVSYMRGLIRHHKIKKQLFVPLFFKRIEGGFVKDPFGIMSFDSAEEDQGKFEMAASDVNKIAKVVVAIILNEQRRFNLDYQLAKKACANILAESQKGFEDEFRNIQTGLEGIVKKLGRTLLREDISEQEKIIKARNNVQSLLEITHKFFGKTSEFISAIKVSPSNITASEQDLEEFIKKIAADFAKKEKVEVNLDFRKLSKRTRVKFDQEQMEKCLLNIMENAVKFKAGKIWIRAIIRNADKNRRIVLITIANDGLKIDPRVADQLFMYFASIDRMTESSGLSIVKSIIDAHDGEIKLQTEPITKFIIQLPLEQTY